MLEQSETVECLFSMAAIAREHVSVEFRDLEYFLACVDEKSVTRAARKVHAAQPTVSHAISRLEAEVGERLLYRGPRATLRTTDAGRLLETHARAALASVRAIPEGIAALRGLVKGTLRVGSIQTLNVTLLPRPLAEFAMLHPGVDISVETYAATEVADAVRSGRADLGLVAGIPVAARAGLTAELLYEEEFVAVVRADDALARRRRVRLAELRDRPMLLASAGTYTCDLVLSACLRAGFSPRVVLALDSGEALRETVRSGLGLTLLPASYVPSFDRTLRALALVDPTPRRQVFVLHRGVEGVDGETSANAPALSAAARAFVATMRGAVRINS